MIHFIIPTSWEQLSPRQLKGVSRLLFTPLQPIALDIAIFYTLLNVRWWQLLRYYRFKRILSAYFMPELRAHHEYIYNSIGRLSFIDHITLSRKRYYPPKKFLYNLTVAEFAVVDDLYMSIVQSLQEKKPMASLRDELETMAAIIYQEDAPDIRRPFAKETLDTLCKPWEKAQTDVLLATYVTYQGCRAALEKRYKRVFSGGGKSQGKPYGFGKVILQMAGKKFGSYNETSNTFIHTLLEQLNEDLTPEKLK